MDGRQKLWKTYLEEDIGMLGFLVCVFFLLLCMFWAEGAEKTECLLMFLILCVPILFFVYKMPLIAYSLTGVQILVYAVYKLYRWSVWGDGFSAVSYAWLVLPAAVMVSLRLFTYGVTKLELKNELLREQVEELVIIDSLTGLYNLRGMVNELTRQMSRAQRNNEKIVLMEVKLKYEQELRSILSAQQFDKLRQRMAELVEDMLRIEDRVFAIDENGTLAILLNCDSAGAKVVERRIRSVLGEKSAFHGIVAQTVKVDLKMGYAEYDREKMESAMDFFRQTENELQYDV